MTEPTSEGSHLEWPERWSDAVDAPPLARAFVKQIARFEAAPVRESPRRTSRLPLVMGAGLVAIAAIAALYFGPVRDSAGEPLALVPANDPLPVAARPATPAPAPFGAPMTTPDISNVRPPVTPATRVEAGLLYVSARPTVAIEIDGVSRGNTPRRLNLTPGRHRLRMTRPEVGIDASEMIEIVAGETLRIVRTFDVPYDPDAAPPRRVNAPSTPPASTPPTVSVGSPYDLARACAIRGEYPCVIANLLGHCTTAREFELLISSMRSSGGYDREVEANMRIYLASFPTGRPSGAYRQYLVAHSGH